MTDHASAVNFIGTIVYGIGVGAMFVFQYVTQKANFAVPEKWMLVAAVGVTLFGGIASYALQVTQRKEDTWNLKHLGNNIALSGFVALLVGLFTDGYLTPQWWLGAILVSSFFKNVILAIIPKALEQRAKAILNYEDSQNAGKESKKRSTDNGS